MLSNRYFTGPPVYTQVSLVQPREMTTLFMQTGLPPFTSGVIQPGVSIDTAPGSSERSLQTNGPLTWQQSLPACALLTAGYTASKQSHLDVTRNINEPLTPAQAYPGPGAKTSRNSLR
jgi:hypothetical protein